MKLVLAQIIIIIWGPPSSPQHHRESALQTRARDSWLFDPIRLPDSLSPPGPDWPGCAHMQILTGVCFQQRSCHRCDKPEPWLPAHCAPCTLPRCHLTPPFPGPRKPSEPRAHREAASGLGPVPKSPVFWPRLPTPLGRLRNVLPDPPHHALGCGAGSHRPVPHPRAGHATSWQRAVGADGVLSCPSSTRGNDHALPAREKPFASAPRSVVPEVSSDFEPRSRTPARNACSIFITHAPTCEKGDVPAFHRAPSERLRCAGH